MSNPAGDLRRTLSEVARADHLLVAADFDGTLAPIVNNPADARALPEAASALRALAELPATTVTLISGRSLRDLTTLSDAPAGVHLIGSHGAEFDTGFTQEIDAVLLAHIHESLETVAAAHSGVTVESKPASVVLHVRNASPADAQSAVEGARIASRSWRAELTEGKAVLEFAVITTDKGAALDILRTRESATAVVFFGDDITDEKAFRRMRDTDVGVKVGPGETRAGFRVDAPADVAAALALLLAERAGFVESHRR